MPIITDASGQKIREYKCKNCGKNVQILLTRWKALPQKYKRWCPDCFSHMKTMQEEARERRTSEPYGPYYYGRFGF